VLHAPCLTCKTPPSNHTSVFLKLLDVDSHLPGLFQWYFTDLCDGVLPGDLYTKARHCCPFPPEDTSNRPKTRDTSDRPKHQHQDTSNTPKQMPATM